MSKRLFLLLALLISLAVVAAQCGAPAAPEEAAPVQEEAAPTEEAAPAEEEAAAPTGETIKIFTSWPLQGPMLPEGESMKRAADLALKHYLEDHGGVGPAGYNVEIVNLDDASPTTGSWDGTIEAENAQRCVDDGDCVVYFGTYNSGAAKVSIPITNKAGIAQITPANTYPGLTHPWDAGEPDIYRPSGKVNYFRTNASDDLQGWAGAAWSSCLGFQKVYVLDDRQLYGKGVADAFIQQAEKIGLEIVGRDGVESTDIDFRALLTKVKAAGPDLVYGGFVIDSGGPQVIQQMASLGLFDDGIKFMGPDGLQNPALVDQVGGPAVADGNVYLTFPGLTGSQLTSEAGERYFKDFQAEYGVEPSPWSTYAYQSMQVILNSIERAGSKDRGAILDAMRDGQYDGITGQFSFNENGDPTLINMGGYLVENGDATNFVGPISPDMYLDCEGAAAAPGDETAMAEPKGETLKVYTSWPLQGPMLPEGESMKRAADLALKHYLEDHGGVGPAGYDIELVNLDDASPTTGSWDGTIEAENAQRCVDDGDCVVYFGTYNSGAAKVSIPITNKAGLAQITPANTYPGLTHEWDAGEPDIYRPSGRVNYFRTNAADDVQGWAGAAWASCLGFQKVYVLDDRQLYGKGVADAFIQQAEKIGLEIVGRDGVESTDIDFRALLTKVKAAGPDLVYGGFVIDSGGPQVIQQMDSLGLFDDGIRFMGPDGLVNPALVDQVGGPEVANGNVLLTFPGLAPSQLESESGKRFFNDFVAEYGVEPSPWSTYAYQSMQVILDSIARAGARDRGAILDAMATGNYDGVTGNFGFNENGDPTLAFLGGNEVQNGEIVYVGSISPDMFQSCP